MERLEQIENSDRGQKLDCLDLKRCAGFFCGAAQILACPDGGQALRHISACQHIHPLTSLAGQILYRLHCIVLQPSKRAWSVLQDLLPCMATLQLTVYVHVKAHMAMGIKLLLSTGL